MASSQWGICCRKGEYHDINEDKTPTNEDRKSTTTHETTVNTTIIADDVCGKTQKVQPISQDARAGMVLILILSVKFTFTRSARHW